jgi:GcrA cell cycle regulator
MDWTNERVDELRRLWGQGQTASRIAELLGGITRNAVIGKAHRLGLCGRPSPIRREDGQRPSRPLRAPAAALAEELTREHQPRQVEPPPAPPLPAPVSGASKQARTGAKTCSWPMGDPKQPEFHFCGEEAEPGRPYCTAHCAMAYQRKSEAAS